MTPIRRTTVLLIASLLVTGCGGGESGSDHEQAQEATQSELPASVAARANANCRVFLRETERIGRDAFKGVPPTTILELATERLVKPSIPLLEQMGDRQQSLESRANDPAFDLYANLYDPIVAIARERLKAGQAADPIRSKNLEKLLTNLGLEQRQAAREAGLRDCNLDFQHALLSSLNR